MKIYLESLIEVGGIAKDAATECYKDAKIWLGGLVAKADEWMIMVMSKLIIDISGNVE